MRAHIAIPVALALVLTACPKKDATTEAAPETTEEETMPTAPPPEEVDPELKGEMQVHFAYAMTAQAAVVAGDLDGAKAAHAKLRDDEAAHVPDPWLPLMADVKAAASEGAEAEALVEAAQAVAKVGRACGECHSATNGGPDLATSPPSQEWTEDAEMLRHAWAVNLMWLGLTAPNDELWKAGTVALAGDDHTSGSALADDVAPRFKEVETRVHEAAKLATDTTDPDEKTVRYAEILSMCATCHAILREE
ncbi:MAG: hypothetical protein EP330_22765 [Deltaproteobacteria bacterium]|nr:MAG: hypothetical protein EP330_22765 [Deltaproteobacteria bacterium]